jgi:HAD superfamily phosphoserine phosphatase-like hydrolase
MKKTAFCFDLDGTVTKQEILPLISKKVGLHEEINLLTDITLKGLIPFETSFKLRVKLLSSIAISVVQEVVNEVVLDENITNFIKQNKENCFIVTGNLDVWVSELISSKLGCQSFSSTALHTEDKLDGIETILNKGKAIDKVKLNFDKIVTIGDSMNDCSMFEKANVRIAYGGIHNPVNTLIKLSDYVVYNSKSLVELLENIKNEN